MLAGVLAIAATPTTARANGAFPDAESLLLPADDPATLILATNFGLVVSNDEGANWSWSCETNAIAGGHFYSLGIGSPPRMYSVAQPGLAWSDDRGCSWTHAGGALTGATVVDAFPDPNDALTVWAAAMTTDGAGVTVASVHRSRDGGASFQRAVLELPAGASVTGLEVARGDSRVVYVAYREPPGLRPRLARSDDGGATFTTIDLEPTLGRAEVRLLAIDRVDPRRVFLRVIPEGGDRPSDRLAVSGDGGATWAVPVEIAGGRLTAFLQRADGTLLVGAIADLLTTGFGTPVGRRSRDGGSTFEDWPLTVRARSLAERGGLLLAATDDLADAAAVQTSTDEGMSWRPLLAYANVRAIRSCARAACFEDCLNKALLRVWDEAMCRAGGMADGGPVADAAADGSTTGSSGGGCSCRLTPARRPTGIAALLIIAAAAAIRRRRR